MTDSDIEIRERSPRSPFITLRKALERAREFYDANNRHAVRVDSATAAWGYASKSSGGRQTLATLIMYGLLQDSGSGADRKVQVTDSAWRYLVDEREEHRLAYLREFALAPKIMIELWKAWRDLPPSDAECRSQLRIERGFTEAAAQDLIAIYKDNVALAKLRDSDIMPSSTPELEPPMKDQPMSEPASSILDRAASSTRPPAATAPMLQEVFNLDEGPVTLVFPSNLSPESYEELKDGLEFFLRRAQRRARARDQEQ